jgi:hypothetical protein
MTRPLLRDRQGGGIMATKILKKTEPPLSGSPGRVLWGPCEIYVCGDPDCRSKVLVLQAPHQEPRHPLLPRCVCGSILEISGSVVSVSLAWESTGWDPSDDRE